MIINTFLTFGLSTLTWCLKEKKSKNDTIKKILKVEILQLLRENRNDIMDQELIEIVNEYYRRGGNGYIKKLIETEGKKWEES